MFFIDLIFFEYKFGICKFSFDFIFIFILYEGFLFSRFLKKIKRRDVTLFFGIRISKIFELS